MSSSRRPRNVARARVGFVILALGMVMASAVPVWSEDSTNQVPSAVDAARERARRQRQDLPFAKGTLTNIDVTRHELKLKTIDGVRAFLYTPRTYIFRNKDKITVDKLKVGEIIAVRFSTDSDGVSTISRIKAYGSPADNSTPPGPSASPPPPASPAP
ncbi:MAG TPA: hypothetical protein VMV72_08320 [Verrucomicrobiae bacterium]|nr:hypothetical protein [Verrucomicrobiae bacterium]